MYKQVINQIREAKPNNNPYFHDNIRSLWMENGHYSW